MSINSDGGLYQAFTKRRVPLPAHTQFGYSPPLSFRGKHHV